jgi:UDP-glucose 4-epimerase
LVTVIPFMTYGPRQKPFKIVPYTILTLLAGGQPGLSSGKRLVDWIYVDDVIDCFVAAGTMPGIEGMTFEVGSSEFGLNRLGGQPDWLVDSWEQGDPVRRRT